MTSLSFCYLSFSPLWAAHFHSFQSTLVKATHSGITQHRRTMWIHTVVTPQLRLILHADKTCTSHSVSPKRKKTEESQLSNYSLSMIWQYLQTPSSSIAYPPHGHLMCLARFGMRHTQINILPRGATVESPR